MSRVKWLSVWFFVGLIVGCSYPERIKDGTTAYQRKQYAVATKMLSKEFEASKSSKEKGLKAFLTGKSYERINDNANATVWYQKAYDNQYGAKALIEYAFALKRGEDYEAASEAFKQVGLVTGEMEKYHKEREMCLMAATWLKENSESEYTVEELAFNTDAMEYAPFILDNNSLVFSSDRDLSEGKETYKWTGNEFSDLFSVDLENNEVAAFASDLNSEYNEGAICFDSQYNTAYFTKCGSGQKQGVDYCKIMFSKKKPDGGWTSPKTMPFVSGSHNYAHPFLFNDRVLYFSSDRPGGLGQADLYYVKKTEEGWSEPASLGRHINTAKDEKFPFRDHDTLYFASNGHPGMGGLDIFKSVRTNNRYKTVENLKPPINSGGDDFALVLDTKREDLPKGITAIGYFSSTRMDGKGKDDIYRFSQKAVEAPPVVIEDSIPPTPPKPEPEIEFKHILEGTVLEKLYGNPEDPNSKVLGFKPLPDAKVFVSAPNQKIVLDSDEKGEFTTNLTESTRYGVTASKEGYFTKSTYLTTDENDKANPVRTYKVELILDRIFRNKEITLEDIYYDFDKWYIRPDAEPSLNRLVTILQQNPGIRIQLSSHTDCRGNNTYNKSLSQKRAQSAVDYLITRGIESSRLEAVGYGEESPAISCKCSSCTEEEHQANRRTTFKVIE